MIFVRPLLFLALIVSVLGCTHSVHIAHVGDFSPTFKARDKGEFVNAKTDQFVILGFVTDTKYVDLAYRQLMSRCEGGEIQGITTQYSTSHGFLSWTNHVEMEGLCLR